ncbi:MAG: FGGY family carbohydrate kinase [Gammaproteobacteria bacterium]|nr:FGGY family carbohydrate kinase [Gammaproteobacteria bacterium]
MPESKPNLTLVIDQGSHASRLALFTETGEINYLKSCSISTSNPEELFYEQDANEILKSLETLLNDIPNELIQTIKNAGLCTQRSSIVAWNKTTGKPLSPVISWRDTRSQPLINQLSDSAPIIRQTTGLPLSAHYSAGKIRWLLDNNSTVKRANKKGELCISPLASYLIFHLLKNKSCVIDHSNAQRCQLFDIHKLDWSDNLLQLFQIEKDILPNCTPVIHHYGVIKNSDIQLTAVCGDQNGLLYAYPSLAKNSALINIGTGAFILSNTKERQSDNPRLLHTLTSSQDDTAAFVTEGTVNGAGAALSWAQNKEPCDELYTKLPIWLKQIKSPPVFINSVVRLGSPWWCNAGKPEFLPHKTPANTPYTQGERYTAIIESIVFLIFKNILQLDAPPDTLFVSGGLSQLDALCQKLADLSNAKVLRFTESEATARGCARLANQALEKNNLKWKALEVSQEFISLNKTGQQTTLSDRYQQFVGELNKRCNND